ncbi:PTS galactosamine/N-acetylgalactosamine transporter subunit IIA [Erysipelotrichaceae bacterium HCN-30851]
MIGLIVTGHGNFASGLTSSLKLIAGEPKNYVAVDFLESYSVEDLERELNKAFDELKDCEGILVLSDLGGGSPFKTAVMTGYPKGNVEVIAGSNLPMLIEVNMGRQFIEDLNTLTEMAVNTGKDQVVRYEFKPVVQEEPTDGI